MNKTLAKVKYCAFERKTYDKDKKYQIEYYVDLGDIPLSRMIKVKGVLQSLEDITEEDYLKWKLSNNMDDFLKQKEYELISKTLTALGSDLRLLSDAAKREFYIVNCDSYLKKEGGRKLKKFEEEIVLNALKGVPTAPTIYDSNNNKHNKH
jgi:hypothetical protein